MLQNSKTKTQLQAGRAILRVLRKVTETWYWKTPRRRTRS